ncbi:MAG: hypothetical protein ACE5JR_05450 [Gemmatimonadota bacterium]
MRRLAHCFWLLAITVGLAGACDDQMTMPTAAPAFDKPPHAGGNGKGNKGEALSVRFLSSQAGGFGVSAGIYVSSAQTVNGQNTADGTDINSQGPYTLTFGLPAGHACLIDEAFGTGTDPESESEDVNLLALLNGKELTSADGFGMVFDKTEGTGGGFSQNDRIRVGFNSFTIPEDAVHVYAIRLHSINTPEYDPAVDVWFEDTVVDGQIVETRINVRKENIRVDKLRPTGKKGKNTLELVDRDTCVLGAEYAITISPAPAP